VEPLIAALKRPRFAAERTWKAPRRGRLGVNFVGPVEFLNGLSTSARGYVESLARAGTPLNVIPWREGFERLERVSYDHARGTLQPINVVHLNLDLLADRLPGKGGLAKIISLHRYNVVIPYWELARVVPEHAHVLRRFDEVWCASSFMASAVSQATDRIVRIVRPALVRHDVTPASAAPQIALPPERFVFFYTADAGSILGRKNPRALLDAYLAEFGPDDGACCVIKIHYGQAASPEFAPFFAAAAARSDIIFIDRLLTQAELASLYSRIDCYVSPHRSEGLGLTLLEAMQAGKPVIATPYGGVTDFVTEQTAFPLAYRVVEVGEGNSPYPASSVWAEPDQRSLRSAMRTVMQDRRQAARIAAAGQACVSEMFGLERTAHVAGGELRRIWTASGGNA
jgi:glycosyltransferase involved in cell wall biosynthesis